MHVSSCISDLTIRMKLNSLKIMDKLQGSLSAHSQYLACSVITDQYSHSPPSSSERQGKDPFAVLMEDDDIFTDALPDFMISHDFAETGISEKDLSTGDIVPGDVFYEAMGSDDSDFVSLTFLSRNPSSLDYDGIDTQVIFRRRN